MGTKVRSEQLFVNSDYRLIVKHQNCKGFNCVQTFRRGHGRTLPDTARMVSDARIARLRNEPRDFLGDPRDVPAR